MKKYLLYFMLTVGCFAFLNTTEAQPLRLIMADKQFDKLNYAKAVSKYERLAKDGYPKVIKYHVDSRIGLCYFHMRKYNKCIPWFQKSVTDDASTPSVWLHYAESLRATGRYKEADKWLTKYNEAEPDNSVVSSLKNTDFDEIKRRSIYFIVDSLDINTNYADFSPAYYDSSSIVFVSSRDTTSKKLSGWTNEPYYDLFISKRDSVGELSQPVKFSNEINTKYHEGPLVFSPDMQTVYFTRNNSKWFRKGKSKDKTRLLKIYTATLKNGKWTDEEELPFNNKEYSCAHPALASDGKTMVFASSMPGGYGGTDLYITKKVSEGWTKPQNLGEKVNTELNEIFPSISPDGTLYFSSDGHSGLGGLDIYYAEPSFSDIQKVNNMGEPVNSLADDFGLIFKNSKGFFTSNRNPVKGDDLYSVIFNRPPVAISDTFYLEIFKDSLLSYELDVLPNDSDPDDNKIIDFETVSEMQHGKVEKKGRKFTYNTRTNAVGIDSLTYRIFDSKGLPADAKIIVYREGKNPPVSEPDSIILTWGEEEDYVIDICQNDSDPDRDLDPSTVELLDDPISAAEVNLNGSELTFVPAPEFLGRDTALYRVYDKKGLSTIDSIFIDIRAIVFGVPMSEGMELSLTLLYDLGKHTIRPDAALILDSLAFYLEKYPGMEIELGSHTDARGSAKSNQRLSQRRAKSAVNYLVKKGINRKRLTYKGYGESRPVNKCIDGVRCSEEEHAPNRRSTIKVTKLRGIKYKSPSHFR